MNRNKCNIIFSTLLALIYLVPSAHASNPTLGPQVTQLSISVSDKLDGTDALTTVKVSFTLKNQGGNLADFQIFLRGQETPTEDPKCIVPPVLVAGGQPAGTVGRTDIGNAISTLKDGIYTIRQYEFSTTYVNADLCSGDWNAYLFHIMDNKSEYWYRYLPASADQFGWGPYLYSMSWDKGQIFPDCPLIGGKNPTSNIGGTFYNRYLPCFEVPDLSKPIGNYDKASSIAKANQDFASQPTAAQLAAESAAAEKENAAIIAAANKDKKKSNTIQCSRGSLIKKVSGDNPKCPNGYRLKK